MADSAQMDGLFTSRRRMSVGAALIVALIAAVGLAAAAGPLSAQTPAWAKDLRGKADTFGGAAENDGMGDAAGSLAIPVMPNF